MNILGDRPGWLAWIAVAGLSVPAPAALGNDSTPSATIPAEAAVDGSSVRDLALAQGGLLAGQVLDTNSRPLAGSTVVIHAAGQAVAETRTDTNGVFAVCGLRGGLHQIVTAQGVETCRLWAPGTAPPRAESQLRIFAGQIVRGQFHRKGDLSQPFPHAKALATNPLVIGGLVAAAVAIPIALNNADEPPGS